MTGLLRGALDPIRQNEVAELKVYAHGRLPAPPEQRPVPAVGDWLMLGNGPDPTLTAHGSVPVGDCTIAAAAHAVMAANAEVGTSDPTPDANQAVAQYLALTGGADTGCVEADVLTAWQQHGLFDGNRIAAFAPVDHTSLLDVHQAVAAYGFAYLGVALPASAERQFAAGLPWTYTGDRPVGGHAILLAGYDPQWAYAVTWGAVTAVSYPWLAAYCTEAWAVIPAEFIEAGRGPEVAVDQLQDDISSLAERRRPFCHPAS